MAKRKTKSLTVAEHAALGQRLYRLRMEAMAIARQLEATYPKASKPVRMVQKVYQTIDTLRCQMDSRIYAEHRAEATPRIYYCGRDFEGAA